MRLCGEKYPGLDASALNLGLGRGRGVDYTKGMVLGVLGSGSGSNMQAILDAIDAGTLDARIALWQRRQAEQPTEQPAARLLWPLQAGTVPPMTTALTA